MHVAEARLPAVGVRMKCPNLTLQSLVLTPWLGDLPASLGQWCFTIAELPLATCWVAVKELELS